MSKQRKIKHYGYGALHRKRRRGKILKILLLLLLFAVLIFLGYCGAKSLGNFLNRPESSSESSAPIPDPLPPELPESSPVSSEESSQPPAEPEEQAVRAVLMPAAMLAEPKQCADFLSSLDPYLYNTVAVPLKDEKGILAYQSDIPLASTCTAISPAAISMDDLEALTASIDAAGFTPAAWIETLKDDYASHASYNTSYIFENQQNVTWLDQAPDMGGKSWLNPFTAETRSYLSELTAEISKAGFRYIFASSIQYPDTPFSQQMGFGPDGNSMSQPEALQAVLDQMISAAAVNGSEIIPIFAGEGYLGEADHWYAGSPAVFHSDLTAPSLPAGREPEVLSLFPDKDVLVPVILPDQRSILESAGISQYIVK